MTNTYKVMCDRCRGSRREDGQLCPKCQGEGEIIISQEELTISQRAAKELALILLAVLVAGVVIGCGLHWFGWL